MGPALAIAAETEVASGLAVVAESATPMGNAKNRSIIRISPLIFVFCLLFAFMDQIRQTHYTCLDQSVKTIITVTITVKKKR